MLQLKAKNAVIFLGNAHATRETDTYIPLEDFPFFLQNDFKLLCQMVKVYHVERVQTMTFFKKN